MGDVVLQINGTNYRGWQSIAITRSLESIADTFELTLTDRWPSSNTPKPIKVGEPCTVSIDAELVITGYIDDVVPDYDATNHVLTVTGRSKAGDLVDCSYMSNTTYKGKTFDFVVKNLCSPFDIDVTVNADVGAPYTQDHKLEPGETVFEFLDRMARYRALRIVSAPDGRLVITRASSARVDTPLALGNNIKSASGSFSLRDRFSDYRVVGQQSGADELFGAPAAASEGLSIDSRVKRYRPTLMQVDSVNSDECKRQAQWHRNTRYGRSQSIVYTVLSWSHSDGLWSPNNLVPVHDDYMAVNGDRLITGVQYLLDENGERTEIEVMPPEAFDLVALPEPILDSEARL